MVSMKHTKIVKYTNNESIGNKMRSKYFEWATYLTYLLLNAVGIWPQVHKSANNKFLCDLRATITFIVITFMGAIPAIHSLIRIWGNMMLMIDNLQITLPMLTALLKLVVIWWKKTGSYMTLPIYVLFSNECSMSVFLYNKFGNKTKNLIEAMNMVAEDWTKTTSHKELSVMIKRAQSARIFTIIGYALMFMGFILYTILPCFGKSVRYRTNITDPDKILPFQTYYLYDKEQSPFFELTFAAQAVLGLMCIPTYSGVDNLLGLLILHLCGQMENLKEKLITIRNFDTFHDQLVFIVKNHIRLIKCYNIIENTFTFLLLGLLAYFSTLFCLYGFLIIMILKTGSEMSVMRFIYLISVVLNVGGHMFLFCVVGEFLVTQCGDIYHAVYEYKWYKLKPKEAKTLILLMIRTSKPLYITAGKMFPMTMSMFSNLLKTSGGYVSVLLARQSV